MANDPDVCPFCDIIDRDETLTATNMGVAFPDAHPVSRGHTLVVPRRHVDDLFELSAYEFDAIWQLVKDVRKQLEGKHSPDGFNVGVNVGRAAGQTVAHAHIHVIPRYTGDVDDPRGGIRWLLPDKAKYLEDG